MRFLVDAHLPPALAKFLIAHGHVAEHVNDRGLQAASDSTIWEAAVTDGAIIITKDEDFMQRSALNGVGPTIIWIRIRNTRRRALLMWFDQAFPAILTALERGETLIEVT